MKRLTIFLLLAILIGGGGWFAWPKVQSYLKQRNQPNFQTATVQVGDIQWTVESTGTIEPVLKVQIGSFVSGPIVELNVDFNDQVEKGDLLAKVDPRLYVAAVQQDKAALSRARADVQRVQAALQQAKNDEERAKQLSEINTGYISQSEMDQLRFARMGLEAELEVAKLQIDQAQAALENSELNLEYTDILAPSAGIVIDRKIDSGQTLVAQFQTPELFVLAPDMNERMWVHANVVEADIGHILAAKEAGMPVKFYVDAYEGELFEGVIKQVRQNPTTDQNVVTYPVVVETPNLDLKLLPGMTANLSFLIDEKKGVTLIPGAALRFLPEARYVRKEDRDLIEGDDAATKEEFEPSAEARVKANQRKKKRHVWVAEEKDGTKQLRAIEVEYGISDGQYYELVTGEVTEKMELVTAIEQESKKS